MLKMAPDLLKLQLYILTYKFCQDHIELLCNTIRRAGGWNNNPNIAQFRAAFKKILASRGVLPNSNGNIVQLDETTDVTLSSAVFSGSQVLCNGDEDTLMTEDGDLFVQDTHLRIVLEHDYSDHVLKGCLTTVENDGTYIAGGVVCKVCKIISCSTCKDSLISSRAPSEFDQSY
ncbi:UNVERIFIED_CONTAM: hypothetical protein FKN15_078460 [Acipenser sinensis]